MKKRLIETLLTLCMALALLPGAAWAYNSYPSSIDWGSCGDHVYWELYSDGQLIIDGWGDMKNYSPPAPLSRIPIVSPWYYRNGKVKSVSICEYDVTSIGNYAFYGCSNLTRVSIPEEVTTIGVDAFTGCSSLTDVYFEGSEAQWNAIEIGDYNDELFNATIHFNSGICGIDLTWTLDSEGVLTISGTGDMNRYSYSGDYSPWSQNDQITSIVINPGATSISSCAFLGCHSLTNITIPISVTAIDFWAFSGTALSRVYYESNEAQWNMISIDDGTDDMGHPLNDEILNATIHYNSTAPSTSSGPSVTVGGKAVVWTDAEPFIDANSRTMVPLRAVADAMGLDAKWNATTREASFTNGSKTISFPIDSATARISGGGTVQMDTTAVIVNERTYAPIRYLAEFFGYDVDWDGATRTVLITL